jgi:hypothetical protein
MAEVIRKLNDTEYPLWDDFINKYHSYPFHVRAYVEALKTHKWLIDYVVLMDDKTSTIKSAVLVQKRRVPLSPFYITYLPYTPIGDDIDLGSHLVEYVIKLYKPKSLKITLQLQTPFTINHQMFKIDREHYTFYVDLEQSTESRFNNYSKSYRNFIRKAVKEGVEVTHVQDEDNIDKFIKMYHNMTDRKEIEAIDHDMIKLIITGLISSNQAILFKTTYQHEDYNYAFVSINGLYARYLYGASIPQSGLPPMGQ